MITVCDAWVLPRLGFAQFAVTTESNTSLVFPDGHHDGRCVQCAMRTQKRSVEVSQNWPKRARGLILANGTRPARDIKGDTAMAETFDPNGRYDLIDQEGITVGEVRQGVYYEGGREMGRIEDGEFHYDGKLAGILEGLTVTRTDPPGTPLTQCQLVPQKSA